MKKPLIALMYDFDKTLCTKDMQEYGFIPKMNMKPDQFWKEVDELTNSEHMDNILSYMYKMVDKAKEKKIHIKREDFVNLGKDIEYFDGVIDWFDRINKFGDEIGVTIEHYIVSSGIKEIIEGTEIAKYFKKIYACEFMYDYRDLIIWPKVAVNYTAKTQFLFRINKGILEIDTKSSKELNRFTKEEDRRIPFRNMIYIGDGLTDVPCMKLVKINGGNSIAVYNEQKSSLEANKLLEGERVDFVVAANYIENSELDKIVKTCIRKIKLVEEVNNLKNDK